MLLTSNDEMRAYSAALRRRGSVAALPLHSPADLPVMQALRAGSRGRSSARTHLPQLAHTSDTVCHHRSPCASRARSAERRAHRSDVNR